jgi:N-hydroxyarylamine O-acetyltransferase
MFDLDAYLDRIGLSGPAPSLAEVHRAHTFSIPFEGLDPYIGRPVALSPEALTEKLLRGGRGGYCFEQNLLLKLALETLGYEVEPLLARVQVGLRPREIRPRTHMLLRVERDGRSWHADVGFGSGTLFEPVPWGPGGEHEQFGWSYRTVERGPEWIFQGLEEGEWQDLYAFRPEPVPAVDVETSNWWTSTHPESRFVSGFLVSRQWPDGRRLILSDWGAPALVERTPSHASQTPVTREELPDLLSTRFGLPGFTLTADGRLAR